MRKLLHVTVPSILIAVAGGACQWCDVAAAGRWESGSVATSAEPVTLAYLPVALLATPPGGVPTRLPPVGGPYAGCTESQATDLGEDGLVDEVSVYRYDLLGSVIRLDEDKDADGKVDSSTKWIYGASHLLLAREYDADADGLRDSVYVYIYDELDRLIAEEYDWDVDGTIDQRISYEHNEAGYRSAQLADYDGDGVVDDVETYTYDADGHLIGVESDYDNDGLVDHREVYFWQDGLMVRSEYWWSGVSLRMFSLHDYDVAGRIIRGRTFAVSEDGEHALFSTVLFRYDGLGHEVEYSRYVHGDLERHRLTSYDSAGRIELRRIADLIGGRWVVNHSYDCP